MYDYIEGKLAEKNPAFVVVEVNGIGFQLHISLNTYTRLEHAVTCRLYTHFVVREDAQLLYGFADVDERDLFRMLISVSGVGPNTARMLLSAMSVKDLVSAISTGQVGLLKSVKGIGEKSAQRIIVDLKDKLDKGLGGGEKISFTHNTLREEALSGLVVLGFQKKLAEKALDHILKTHGMEGATKMELTVESLIREALKHL
jgi:Holliday junction DNA helicase RuvA